jgi:hypothetical protein
MRHLVEVFGFMGLILAQVSGVIACTLYDDRAQGTDARSSGKRSMGSTKQAVAASQMVIRTSPTNVQVSPGRGRLLTAGRLLRHLHPRPAASLSAPR